MKALIHVFHLNLAIRDWCEHLKNCTLIAQNLKRPTRNVVISFEGGGTNWISIILKLHRQPVLSIECCGSATFLILKIRNIDIHNVWKV